MLSFSTCEHATSLFARIPPATREIRLYMRMQSVAADSRPMPDGRRRRGRPLFLPRSTGTSVSGSAPVHDA